MHIKLIYPAQPFLRTEVPRSDGSLGLLYIAGALRDAGFEVSLLDVCVGDNDDLLEQAFFHRTPIDSKTIRVGLSADNLSAKLQMVDVVAVTSIFTMNTQQAFEVAKVAKQLNSNTLTIAGGGNASALHSLFLDNKFDIVVFGEGEETMVDLCRTWEKQGDLSKVSGIAFKNKQGEIITTATRPVEQNLDNLPYPAWDLLPLAKYWQIGDPPGGVFAPGRQVRYLTMQTSRGCPFRCSYCHISKESDAAQLRLKSDDRVWKELEIINDIGAEHVLIQDDSLLANRDRIMRLFNKFKLSGLGFSDTNGINVRHLFRGPTSNPVVDFELLDAMKASGMTDIAFAFESGSRRIVNKYASKKWDPARHDAVSLIKETVARGFTALGFFTIGYPDETLDELNETFMLAKRLVAEGLEYANFYVVTPYPGTVLYDLALKNGNLPGNLDLSKMKFQVPTLINTVIPAEVIQYSRQLAYKLIHPLDKVVAKDSKTIAADGGKYN